MSDCVSAEMRDALPDLIHGSLDAARAAEVEAHVASCSECAAELELLGAVLASAPGTPELDLDRIVTALPTPPERGLLLHQGGGKAGAPGKPQTIWSRPLLRVAATAAIVTAGGLSLLVGRDALNPERQARPVASVPATAPSAAAASTRAATSVPARAEERPPAARPAASAGLSLVGGDAQDLSDEHLATLLSEMDHLDPIPAAEPEMTSPSIGIPDSIGMIQ